MRGERKTKLDKKIYKKKTFSNSTVQFALLSWVVAILHYKKTNVPSKEKLLEEVQYNPLWLVLIEALSYH